MRVDFLVHHANPIAAVNRAARTAAIREAEAQIARLQSINLDSETPHNRLVVLRWLKELREVTAAARRELRDRRREAG